MHILNIENRLVSLKYAYFKEIYIDHYGMIYLKLFNQNHNHYSNIEFGSEYTIIKSKDKIYCLNKKSYYIDLKNIYYYDIQYMRINYKSFYPNINIDEYCICMLSKEIIDEIIKYIFNNKPSVPKYFYDTYKEIPLYELPYDDQDKPLTNIINLNNLNILLLKIVNAKNNLNKLKLLKYVFNYVYNNIDTIILNQRLLTKIKQILYINIYNIYLLINKYILDEKYIEDNKLLTFYDAIMRLIIVIESEDNIIKILNNGLFKSDGFQSDQIISLTV